MEIPALHQLFLTCHSVCTDTRNIKKNSLFFAIKGSHFDGNTFAEEAIKLGAAYAIVDNPEFHTTSRTILVGSVLETLQKLAAYHRKSLKTPLIALTGSNGKTTTKELIDVVLSKKYKTTATFGNLNNHIGVPLTLLSMTKSTEIGIIEMGANHQKEIDFLCSIAQPDFGYITNFGKAHLEGFGGIKGVIKGKCELYDYLSAANKMIFVNASDSLQMDKTKQARRHTFGAHSQDSRISLKKVNPFVSCDFHALTIQSQLIGDYNFNNIAAAIAIGDYFKVSDTAIKSAIESYIPNNNRSQIINRGTNKIILDAYNANPTSMLAALSNFDKQKGFKIAILGDMFELGNDTKKEHQHVAEIASALNIDKIILVGKHFYQTEGLSKKASKYKTLEALNKGFSISDIKNTNLLIKGSRGMTLERILDK